MAQQMELYCVVRGGGSDWEAFCLSLDLAVQGRSYVEVRQKLVDQIQLYLEHVESLPAEERGAFLRRGAPFLVKLKFAIAVMRSVLRKRNHNGGLDAFPIHGVPAGA